MNATGFNDLLYSQLLGVNQEKANTIIENMPYIHLELEYDGSTGEYRSEFYELEVYGFWIECSLIVKRFGYTILGDWENDSEYVETSKEIHVDLKAIYEGEEEISLDRSTIEKVEKAIKKSITY